MPYAAWLGPMAFLCAANRQSLVPFTFCVSHLLCLRRLLHLPARRLAHFPCPSQCHRPRTPRYPRPSWFLSCVCSSFVRLALMSSLSSHFYRPAFQVPRSFVACAKFYGVFDFNRRLLSNITSQLSLFFFSAPCILVLRASLSPPSPRLLFPSLYCLLPHLNLALLVPSIHSMADPDERL